MIQLQNSINIIGIKLTLSTYIFTKSLMWWKKTYKCYKANYQLPNT